MRRISNRTDDGWQQYDDDEGKDYIHRKAGREYGLSCSSVEKAQEAEAVFLHAKR